MIQFYNDRYIDDLFECTDTIEDMRLYYESLPDISVVDFFYSTESKNRKKFDAAFLAKHVTDSNNTNTNKIEIKDESIITKALNALKKFIGNIMDTISNFFMNIFASKEDKDRLKQFQAYLDSHPEFKGKKVRMVDFVKIEKLYDDAIKEVDIGIEELKSTAEERQAEVESKIRNKIKNIMRGTTGAAIITVGLTAALKMCEARKSAAHVFNFMLKKEDSAASKLVANLGDKASSDYKKKVKSCTHIFSLQRLKAELLGRKSKSLGGAIKDTFDDIGKLFTGKTTEQLKRVDILDRGVKAYNNQTGSNVSTGKVAAGIGATKVLNNVRKSIFGKK